MSPKTSDDALLLAALAGALPEQLPDEAVRLRLRKQLLDRAAAPVGMKVLRADEGEWVTLLPGVLVKTLRQDATSQTTLWRVLAGASVPAHVHSAQEECLVLEGSIVHDGIEYFAGDFLLAEPGDRHCRFETPRGALFMIRGEPVPGCAEMAQYLGQ